MGKKNKFKTGADGDKPGEQPSTSQGAAQKKSGDGKGMQKQQKPEEQKKAEQQSQGSGSTQQSKEGSQTKDSGQQKSQQKHQKQEQRRDSVEQRSQQQQQQQQQQRPQQQQHQQRPQQQQQQQQQQRPQQQQQQQRPQQQQQQRPQQQQQQQRPQQQQQQRPQQQQQQQQRPQQQQQQQQRPQQQQQQRPQQQQQQMPQQQQQQQQQQRPQQQQQQQQWPHQEQQHSRQEGGFDQRQQQYREERQYSQRGRGGHFEGQRPQYQQQRQDRGDWSQRHDSGQQKPHQGQQHSRQESGSDQRQQQYRDERQYSQRGRGSHYEGQRPQYQQQRQDRGDWSQGPSQQRPSEQQLLQQLGPQKQIPSASSIPRGTVGRSGTVETNYLMIDMEKMPSVAFHYDVSFQPDRPKKFLRQAFKAYNNTYFPNNLMAFDGSKSFYTARKLECESHEGNVEIHDAVGKSMNFKLSIKETSDMEIDLNCLKTYTTERVFDKPMRAFQCLDVVLASACENGVRAGRSFYAPSLNRQYDLDDGYEMWLGLYQAMVLGDVPLLNVDVSHKSFPKACNLIDHLKQVLQVNNLNQTLDRRDFSNLSEYLKDISIVYTPPNCFGALPKTFMCKGIAEESALNAKFDKDGENMTVDAYYRSRNYQIRYPGLNLLMVGSSIRTILLPIELCSVPAGQALNKKNSSRQIQKLIRYAATSTNDRKDRVMELLTRYQHNANSIITEFGIKIDPRFIVVSMRILNSPKLEYFGNATADCFKGVWRADREKFFKTGIRPHGHTFAILYYQDGPRASVQYGKLEQLASMLCERAAQKNLQLAKPTITPFSRIEDKLFEIKKTGYDFVIVVIPDYKVTYSDIKKAAELKFGLLTQCIKAGTFNRLNMQLIDNILLKINTKLNGTNHIISARTHVQLKDVMYMGADVTHPSPDQRHIPSVVGVVGSHDINGANYNMQYRLQSSKKEVIEDMESIFTNLVSVYFKHQKKYPEHIIYFRDGVSDGQFPQIEREEVRSIRAACKKLRFNPKITCIIVIKRHHTRFFPQCQPNDKNKFNNVEPGSVVDRTIVHPNEVQFFLCSHQAIQGTAKPARYNVIVDDAKMNIDDIQKLCYNMCHLFPRCNRAVSYPAPAYLSHLVAFRGRAYLEKVNNFGNLKNEYEKRMIARQIMENNPMFFV